MPTNYPRPFTPAWEVDKPSIYIVGPKVISQNPRLPMMEMIMPEIMVFPITKAIKYNLAQAIGLGSVLGSVIYIILKLVDVF